MGARASSRAEPAPTGSIREEASKTDYRAGDPRVLFSQLGQCLFGFGQFGALFVDDGRWCLVDEGCIGQLAAHASDFTVQALDFLVQASQFGVLVDQPGP